MSSREIAELTGKNHKDVMRDIRNMLDELGETSAQFCADLPDTYGRKQPAFSLPKDLTLTLVAGYNVKLRKRIIDRWLELESQQPAPQFRIPQTMSEALGFANPTDAMKQHCRGVAKRYPIADSKGVPKQHPLQTPVGCRNCGSSASLT